MILFRSVLLVALVGAPAAFAQQSMFNVPSGTGTARGGFFFQEQVNASRIGESNLTAAVGVGGGVELGLNLFHVNLWGEDLAESARNMVMANAIFTIDFTRWLTLQLGVQFGFARDHHLQTEVPVGFGYFTLRFHPESTRFAAVLGAWSATESYVGPGWPAGPLAGLEYELVREWLVLQADLLMGSNEAAVAVIGAVLLLPLGWQLAVGVQVPSPFSHNGFGAVLEVTHVPPGVGDYDDDLRWQKDRVHPKWIREHKEKHGIGEDDEGEPREED